MVKVDIDNHGFMLVEALLIVIALAVIGFGGYYVWHNQHPAAPPKTISPRPTPQRETKIADARTFKIKEFGIEIAKVPADLSDMQYSVKTVSNIDSPYTSAGFTTTALMKADAKCTADISGGSIGSLKYYKGNYSSDEQHGPIQFVKQFPGFWIGFLNNGVPCTEDKAAVNLEAAQMSELSQLVTNSSNLQPL